LFGVVFAAVAAVLVLLNRMLLARLKVLCHGLFVLFLVQRCSRTRIRCFWPSSTRRRHDEAQQCGTCLVSLLSRIFL